MKFGRLIGGCRNIVSNSKSTQATEFSFEKTTQSPDDGVPAFEASTLNFTKISSLVRLCPSSPFNVHNIHWFLPTATRM
jgi:hypothetical protein